MITWLKSTPNIHSNFLALNGDLIPPSVYLDASTPHIYILIVGWQWLIIQVSFFTIFSKFTSTVDPIRMEMQLLTGGSSLSVSRARAVHDNYYWNSKRVRTASAATRLNWNNPSGPFVSFYRFAIWTFLTCFIWSQLQLQVVTANTVHYSSSENSGTAKQTNMAVIKKSGGNWPLSVNQRAAVIWL